MHSIRFALRQLKRSPGFSLTVILTLALGIGAATSIFSVVNAVLLEPFAFHNPGQLVILREVVKEMRAHYPDLPVNYRHYLRLKADSKSLQDAAIFMQRGISVSHHGDHPQIVSALITSPNMLSMLNVSPAMGRDFRAEEATDGRSGVAILTWEGWRSLLNGVPDPIGRTIQTGSTSSIIIGVLPPSFRFPVISPAAGMPSPVTQSGAIQILVPLVPNKGDLQTDFGNYNYSVIARLRPRTTIAQAQSELEALQQAHAQFAHLPVHEGVIVTSFLKDVTADYSSAIWLVFAAIGVVLLIACANLANLQMARAVAMDRESAVRAALGASGWKLLLTRLTESLVLAFLGGVSGITLASLGIKLLVILAPADVPRLDEVRLSLPVLAFAATLSIVASLLFGLLPALRVLKVQPLAALQTGSQRSAGSKQFATGRNLLVICEVACTVTLLVVTGLVVHSLSALLTQNRGFDSGHVTLGETALSTTRYVHTNPNAMAARITFIDRTLQRLEQIPGVEAAGVTSTLPLTGEAWIDWLYRADHPAASDRDKPQVNVRWISPGYLAAMRIPLIEGRDMSRADRSAGITPVLISEKAARTAYPGEDPIGKKIKAYGEDDDGKTYTIVGVVADGRVNGLKDSIAMVYVAYWDSPRSSSVSFIVRSALSSDSVIPQMRVAIWKTDPEVAIPALKSLDEQVSESVATDRFQAILMSAFGVSALMLALLGVYGVLSYSVSLRQQEFGIRIALGSNKSRLMRFVLYQAAWPVLSGIAVGLALAFVATREIRGFLYEVKAVDPLAIAVSLLLVCGVAIAASIVPARKATMVDPVEVLRAS